MHINEKQKYILAQRLDPIFSHIAQLDTGLRKKVLDAMTAEHLAPESSTEYSYKLWTDITFIRSILAHPSPQTIVFQNKDGSFDVEERGLSLTTHNDSSTAAITKEDITAYIHQLIQQTSSHAMPRHVQ